MNSLPKDSTTQFCICIGAKKAGTTWLYRCLQEHPDIRCSPTKEPHYFSKHYNEYEFVEYLKIVDAQATADIVYESSVSYLADFNTPARIMEHLPSVKLVLILRNPVERAFSDYCHFVTKGYISAGTPISIAVEAQPEILNNSLYGKHLSRYLEFFDTEQLHIIKYEDLSARPQEVLDHLCGFLNIKTFSPSIVDKKYHSTQARLHPLYFRLNRLYLKLRKNALGQLLIRCLRSCGINGMTLEKIFSRTSSNKLCLSEKDRKWLSNHFIEDQKKLSRLLDQWD